MNSSIWKVSDIFLPLPKDKSAFPVFLEVCNFSFVDLTIIIDNFAFLQGLAIFPSYLYHRTWIQKDFTITMELIILKLTLNLNPRSISDDSTFSSSISIGSDEMRLIFILKMSISMNMPLMISLCLDDSKFWLPVWVFWPFFH